MAKQGEQLGVAALVALGIGAISAAATAVWFTARAQGAFLYGLVRSVELPILSGYLPFAEYFKLKSLRTGTVPGFNMIYLNSIIYGLIFVGLILVLAFIALGRVEKFHIKKFVEVSDPKGLQFGRSYEEIMERYAVTQPDVRFFQDYNLIDLSLIYGVGRQAMTALDFLVYSGGIKSVVVDDQRGLPPTLLLDDKKIREYYVDRLFGPRNPFLEIPSQKLVDLADIEAAIGKLRWDAAIILYTSLLRFQAFYVEEDSRGYKTITAQVDAYTKSVWSEINELKKEFGDGIALGYDSAVNRREREERYALSVKAGKDKDRVYDPSVSLENRLHYARILDDGKEELLRTPDFIDPALHDKYGAKNAWQTGGKGKKKRKPDELLFVGEVLTMRGPSFKCVETARAGLLKILTRHLSGLTGEYPVGLDPKTHVVVYRKVIADGAEQAFNAAAQERSNDAAQRMGKILFGHTWTFGVVGDALECVRESGIMPPNLFRYLRFSRETRSMWWFVQNLGSPSAYPENAALMEHYNAERATGMALLRPYIVSSLTGLKAEAEKYLTPETTEELVSVLGKGALLDLVQERRKHEREAMRRAAASVAQKGGVGIGSALGGDGRAYRPDFLDTMESEEDYRTRKAAESAGGGLDEPRAPTVPLGQVDPVAVAQAASEQTGASMMDMLRNKVLPRQIELAQARDRQRKVAEEVMRGGAEDGGGDGRA